MPVRLRGHHFLCMLTYRGEGYTEAFTANMTEVIKTIKNGALIQLVTGPDDICAGLSTQCRIDVDHNCAAQKFAAIDIAAIEEVSACLDRDLSIAAPVTRDEIATLRSAYKAGTIRTACKNCQWKPLCDREAEDDFQLALLF